MPCTQINYTQNARTNTKTQIQIFFQFGFQVFSTNFQVPPHYYKTTFSPLPLEYIRTRCHLRIGLMLHFIITISIKRFSRFQVCSLHFIGSKVRYIFSAAKTRATNNNKIFCLFFIVSFFFSFSRFHLANSFQFRFFFFNFHKPPTHLNSS